MRRLNMRRRSSRSSRTSRHPARQNPAGWRTVPGQDPRFAIKTDGKWKNFKYRYEVPKSVLKRQFDYQDPDDATDGFFKYKNTWYHFDQFMRSPIKGWDGYLNDSMSTGVLIKVSRDGEQYQVAVFAS